MDYYHDADPLISSTIYPGGIDTEPYPGTKIIIDDSASDIPLSVDSPDSIHTYNESEIELTFHDSASVSSVASVVDEINDSASGTPQKDDDADIEADRRLVSERFAPHDLFPADNTWSLTERVNKLLQLSPCKKYTREDLLNIDSIESPEKKVDMLIEIVSKVHVNHRWNYVQPHELHRGYTVVANCKKEKKRDSEGHSCPKRPMNAFMIWSMKCRALIAQITPQLHNAIISTKLGAAWRKFGDQEKALYEREKDVLGTFHKFEFPDYKYKPKKKAKKAEEKSTPEPKQPKCLKRKRPESAQLTAPLRGVSIADVRQSLDPLLKERLMTKMQVKIDPVLKKEIGKRVTAIDFALLSGFKQHELSSSLSDIQFHKPSSKVHLIIDDTPNSVFDTPENSPNKPGTPERSADHEESHRSDQCFDFDEDSSAMYASDSCDSTNHSDSALGTFVKNEDMSSSVKHESNLHWNLNLCIKTEPFELACTYPTHTTIKSEVEQSCSLTEGYIPILSAEAVDAVLDNERLDECTSSFNSDELLDDFMKYLDNDICSL